MSSLRTQLKRAKSLIKQKVELGEAVQPTDFEELRIENKRTGSSLEEKNKYLVKLKKFAGFI